MTMNFKKNFPSYIIAFSLFSLSIAIVSFTLEIRNLTKIFATDQNQSTRNKELVIGDILSEVREVRKHLPNILAQVEKTRSIIPTVLAELKQARWALPGIHKSINNVHSSINKLSKELPNISKEISHITQIEQNIPNHLDRIEDIIDKAKNLGKESSKGVASGFLSGLLTLPFDLVSGLIPDTDIKLTRTDNRLIREAAEKLLVGDQLNVLEYWENLASTNSGSIELVKIRNEDKCRSLKIKISQKKIVKLVRNFDVCQDKKGQWKQKE
jgi:hypothetical protein